MAATNRRFASERMTTRNPMRREEVRARSSATLRRIGWKPPVQCGKGRPMPEAQRVLAEALGWETEVVVPTGLPKGPGNPAHYMLDMADPSAMVAVEVDGFSHTALAVRARDARKDAFLRGRGWTVLRFTNAEVTGDLDRCVRMVTSTTSRSRAITTISRLAS